MRICKIWIITQVGLWVATYYHLSLINNMFPLCHSTNIVLGILAHIELVSTYKVCSMQVYDKEPGHQQTLLSEDFLFLTMCSSTRYYHHTELTLLLSCYNIYLNITMPASVSKSAWMMSQWSFRFKNLRNHLTICKITIFYALLIYLTHWGRVMHICVRDLTIIGSNNGLSPGPEPMLEYY